MTWLTNHAAWLLNHYSVHDDGAASYQRIFRGASNPTLVELVASAMLVAPNDIPSDAERRWEDTWQTCGSQRQWGRAERIRLATTGYSKVSAQK